VFAGRHNWHNFVGGNYSSPPRKMTKEFKVWEQENKLKVAQGKKAVHMSRKEQLENWSPLTSLYRTLHSVTLDTIEINSQQYARIEFKGESFVLYQIRKMVSFWLLLVRGILPLWTAPLAVHSPFKFNIPPAPSVGLVLKDIEEKQDQPLEEELFALTESEAEHLKTIKENVIYPQISLALQDPSNMSTFNESLGQCVLTEDDQVTLQELGKEFFAELEVSREAHAPRKMVTSIVRSLLNFAFTENGDVKAISKSPRRDYRGTPSTAYKKEHNTTRSLNFKK